MSTKTANVSVDEKFYVVNKGANAFYRVSYPARRLQILATQLDKLDIEDKIFITSSAADLAFAGYSQTPALLDFVQGLKNETHYLVINAALDAVSSIKSVFGGDAAIKVGMDKFTLALLKKPLQQVGWTIPENDDFNTALLRQRVLLEAGLSGDTSVTKEALSRFDTHRRDPTANVLPTDLRQPIYRIALQNNPALTVTYLRQTWYSTTAVDGKEVCLKAMGHVASADIITNVVLPFLFNRCPPALPADTVAPSDMSFLAKALGSNRVARPLLWKWIQENWDDVTAKIGGNSMLFGRFVEACLSGFAEVEMLGEIDHFFADKDLSAFDRALQTCKDKIRGRAEYRVRDGEAVKKWLAANGYL